MVSRLNVTVWGLVCLGLVSAACSKEKDKNKNKFSLSQPHQERQLIINFKPGTQATAVQEQLKGLPVETVALNESSYLIKFKDDVDLSEMAEQITVASSVKSVEANVIYRLYENTPNDLEFAKLYGMKNTGQLSGVSGADIGATKAWDQTTGSREVLVGVIDSGMDYNHPDLKDNVWINPGESGLDAQGLEKQTNGIDDDQNGFVDDFRGWDFFNQDNDPMDDNSHGTHVAGTIGGVGNNGVGVVGVNWSVSMVPIKVFAGDGSTTTDILVKGIDYATKLGVFVSNNSWGGGEFSDAIFGAIEKASARNILFIAAAGNESENNDVGDHYPSNYELPNIVSVAAINRRDQISGFSNHGARTVDVAAPGEDIYSTVPGGKYALKSGTSMAAPHVTGSIALIRARFPDLSPQSIMGKLISTSVPTTALNGKIIHGRINVGNAMELDTIPPSLVGGFAVVDTTVSGIQVSWNRSGDDNEIGEAAKYEIRHSAEPVLSEAGWKAAQAWTLTKLTREDTVYKAAIEGMPFNLKGFLTIRAVDNVGNVGPWAESLPFALNDVQGLWFEDNGADHNWDKFGSPWAVDTIAGTSVVSDSPSGALYANGLDKSVVSKEIGLGNANLVLEIRMKYQLEKDYDFGFIELSVDGGITWSEIAKFTGSSDWTSKSFNLSDAIGINEKFMVRLRLKSDQSVNLDGWDIDSLRIMGPKA